MLADNEILSPVTSPHVPRHSSQPHIINRQAGYGTAATPPAAAHMGRSASHGQVRIMTSPQVIVVSSAQHAAWLYCT